MKYKLLFIPFLFLGISGAQEKTTLFDSLYDAPTRLTNRFESTITETEKTARFGYQIRVETRALKHLIQKVLDSESAKNIEVFKKEFRIFLKKDVVSATVKEIQVIGVNRDWHSPNSLDMELFWKFSINWPLNGARDATARSKIQLNTQMLPKENHVLLHMEQEMELLDGWVPDGPILKKIGHWVLSKGIEHGFQIFSKQMNEILQKHVGSMIPPIQGQAQELRIESLETSGNLIEVKLSSLIISLKDFLIDSERLALFGKILVIQDVRLEKEQIEIFIGNRE